MTAEELQEALDLPKSIYLELRLPPWQGTMCRKARGLLRTNCERQPRRVKPKSSWPTGEPSNQKDLIQWVREEGIYQPSTPPRKR